MINLFRKPVDPELAALRDVRLAQRDLCDKSVGRLKAAQSSLANVSDALDYLAISIDAINGLHDTLVTGRREDRAVAPAGLTFNISTSY